MALTSKDSGSKAANPYLWRSQRPFEIDSLAPTMSLLTHDTPAANDTALELRDVTKFYGNFRAVDEVSFRLPRGSIYGFLGPNGAGKTTTLRMILDIIRPTSGAITILGQSSAIKVRQRVGYLPEEKGLYKK